MIVSYHTVVESLVKLYLAERDSMDDSLKDNSLYIPHSCLLHHIRVHLIKGSIQHS